MVLVNTREQISKTYFGTALASVGQRSGPWDGLVAMQIHDCAKRFTTIAQTQAPAIEAQTTVFREKKNRDEF